MPDDIEARGLPKAIRRAVCGKCPRCGEGKLFDGFLKVAARCNVCGEAFHHHRADDAPAYLTILIVGHVMLPVVLGVEEVFSPPTWVHVALWGTLIPGFCLALLRPLKAAIVALQWAHRMHGFGGGDEGELAASPPVNR